MKIQTFIITLIIYIISTFSNISAQTTQGKEFWLAFMTNGDEGPERLSLIISAKRACSGTVTDCTGHLISNFNVSDNGLVDIMIPLSYTVTESEKIEQLGINVLATDTISLYASNYELRSFDVTNVLPNNVLGSEYMIQVYPFDHKSKGCIIVATEDNTVVNITPSAPTIQGKLAKKPFSITLQKGSAYQVLSSDNSKDISGTTIKAEDGKKISVFNANLFTNIPQGCYYADYIVEQAYPTAYWGRRFAVTPTAQRYYDIVRITALNNNTQIKINGLVLDTINSGETYSYNLRSTLTKVASCYIETSEPCAVYMYLVGLDCGGSPVGDPSMVWISPIEQQMTEITFGTFQTIEVKEHYVNIVAATANISHLLLDGKAIGDKFKLLDGNSLLSFAQIVVTAGTHTLKSDNNSGFIAHIYGLGFHESYAYSAGSNTVNLNKQIIIDGTPSIDIDPAKNFCTKNVVQFEALYDLPYKRMEWEFGDGGTASGNKVNHTYKNKGTYRTRLVVERINMDPTKQIVDTLIANIHVELATDDTIHASVCEGTKYAFNNTTYNTTGKYTVKYNNIAGCDSIVTLDLIVRKHSTNTTKKVICEGESVRFNGVDYSQSGIYKAILPNSVLCDSVDILDLTVNKHSSLTFEKTIFMGERFPFNNTYFFDEGVYVMHLPNAVNCDSTITLTINFAHIPNTLTPNGDGINDVLMKGWHVQIYNRNGILIHESDDGWDGTSDNKPVPQGTYFYVLSYISEEKRKAKQGYVVVVR